MKSTFLFLDEIPALNAWIRVLVGLGSYIADPLNMITQASSGIDVAYLVSTTCCRFLFLWPFTWAAVFAAFSQMLSVPFSIRGVLIQSIKSFVGVVIVGGFIGFVIQLPLAFVTWLSASILPGIPDLSLDSFIIIQTFLMVLFFATGIMTGCFGAGVGASWDIDKYRE